MNPDIDEQIRTAFRKHGLEPGEIQYNEKLEYWRVKPQEEGTDNRFMRPTGEIGAPGPTDQLLNYPVVRTAAPEIDGARIPAGNLSVEMLNKQYFKVTIGE